LFGLGVFNCDKSVPAIVEVAKKHTVDAVDIAIRKDLNKHRIKTLTKKHRLTQAEVSPTLIQSTYNVFVKLEMSKADYLHAKASVLIKLRDRFKDEGEIEARKKAEKLLEDLKNDIKTQT